MIGLGSDKNSTYIDSHFIFSSFVVHGIPYAHTSEKRQMKQCVVFKRCLWFSYNCLWFSCTVYGFQAIWLTLKQDPRAGKARATLDREVNCHFFISTRLENIVSSIDRNPRSPNFSQYQRVSSISCWPPPW